MQLADRADWALMIAIHDALRRDLDPLQAMIDDAFTIDADPTRLRQLRLRGHRRVHRVHRHQPAAPRLRRRDAGPYLGVRIEAWSTAGEPVIGQVGEMVITAPMPSMPVRFWNDPDGTRYHDAYFGTFPGIWRHGDWMTVTADGTYVVHGRSDSTINRGGVRMGSADIYQAIDSLPEIAGSLVIGAELGDGDYYMPLFVVLAPGAALDDDLIARIRRNIRSEVSPRHVPDEHRRRPRGARHHHR